MKVKKAVIPAAGYGTRFLPITKGVPKEMLNVAVKPAIHYIVEEAVESGIEEILIIINEGKECIKKYFDPSITYKSIVANENLKELNALLDKANISFAYQDDLNGNGGAILVAEEFANNEPFAVLFGDDVIYNPSNPVTKQLVNAYEKTGKTILGVQHRPKHEAIKYGTIEGTTDGRYTKVETIVEKPSIEEIKSTLCSLGRFILTPDIFHEIKNVPLQSGEIYLTNAIAQLINTKGVIAYEFEGRRFDLGDKFGFLEANIEMGLLVYGERLKEYIANLIS